MSQPPAFKHMSVQPLFPKNKQKFAMAQSQNVEEHLASAFSQDVTDISFYVFKNTDKLGERHTTYALNYSFYKKTKCLKSFLSILKKKCNIIKIILFHSFISFIYVFSYVCMYVCICG